MFIFRLVFEVFFLGTIFHVDHFSTKALRGHFLLFNLYLCTEIRMSILSVIEQFI